MVFWLLGADTTGKGHSGTEGRLLASIHRVNGGSFGRVNAKGAL
jgi:hypothetical protein